MKKFYVFFLLLWICVKPAYAKTYYSEYGDFTNYSEEKISASDILKVESKNFYHAYTEKVSYEYLEDSLYEKTGNYSNEYSKWNTNKDLLDSNHVIEQCSLYTYKPFKEMKYFYLNNLSNKIRIDSIKVYDTKTGNILMQNNNFTMYSNDTFIFNIDKEYNLANLEIHLSIYKQNVNDLKLTLSMNNENNPFINKTLVKTIQDNTDNKNIELVIDNFSTAENLLSNTTATSYCDKNVNGKIINEVPIYRNIYTKYEYKIITKEYLDLYTDAENSNYKLDYDDYKTYYRYKIRNKVVLNDNIIIENKDIDFRNV